MAKKDKGAKARSAEQDVREGASGQQNGADEYDYERSVKLANRGCLIAFSAFILAVAAVMLWAFLYISGEINGKNATATGEVVLNVPANSTRSTIGELLKENGLIGNDTIFRFYVRFNGLSGYYKGQYALEAGMSYDEILAALTKEPEAQETVRVMFPEGGTLLDFAARAEREGLCTAEEFVAAANDLEAFSDLEFVKHLDTDPDTWMRGEGYLAPNTYDFFVGDDPHNVVRTLYEQFDREMSTPFASTGQTAYERMAELDISLREVVTLASLVEEEAGLPENQAGVAGVFWNRLTGDLSGTDLTRRTMGSDVTLRYLTDWVARDYGSPSLEGLSMLEMKDKMLEIMPSSLVYAYYTGDEDPNTREGLPAGPISNPSRTAIEAALWPEPHNYYYFLTDYYGEYYYARTYNEHQRNINTMYQQNAKWEAEQGTSASSGG